MDMGRRWPAVPVTVRGRCPAWCGERPVRNPQVCWENVRVPPALKRTCTSSWRKCSAHKKEASFRPASLA